MTSVWHVYANRQNMGDWASMLGIRQALEEAAGGPIAFRDAFYSDAVDDAALSEMAQVAGAVVVGGGGAWWNKPATRSGWMWEIATADLAKLPVPLIFWGVGLNAEWRDEAKWRLPPAAVRHVVEAVRRARLAAVRDQWTADFLADAGLPGVPVIPCPSVCLRPRPAAEAGAKPAASTIAVNLLPSGRLASARVFLNILERQLGRLQRAGHRLLYVAHAPTAEDTLAAMRERVPGELVVPSTPLDVVDAYARADLAVVMRGHGVLLAMAAGTPAVTVAYNRKCRTFAEQARLSPYLVDWRPGRLLGRAAGFEHRLSDAVRRLIDDLDGARMRLLVSREEITAANRAFARQVAALLRAAGAGNGPVGRRASGG